MAFQQTLYKYKSSHANYFYLSVFLIQNRTTTPDAGEDAGTPYPVYILDGACYVLVLVRMVRVHILRTFPLSMTSQIGAKFVIQGIP